jgi:hypothetical protein
MQLFGKSTRRTFMDGTKVSKRREEKKNLISHTYKRSGRKIVRRQRERKKEHDKDALFAKDAVLIT